MFTGRCSLAWLVFFTIHGAVAQSGQIIFPITNSWRYEQTANLDGTNWQAVAFDDSAWPRGNGLLYFEDNVNVTPRNTPLTIGRMTYYFRTHFLLTNVMSGGSLIFSNLIDDGAVFYLNGTEVQRLRMPPSPTVIGYGTPATANATEASYDVLAVTGENLVAGDNVLAVEVHQANATSSDIVFGCALSLVASSGTFTFTQQPTNVTVVDGRPAGLRVATPPSISPALQWYKDGMPVPGATLSTMSFSRTTPANAGSYWVVASNVTMMLTSAVAVVTVVPDNTAPVVARAIAQKDLTTITVDLTEEVRPHATNLANYRIVTASSPTNELPVVSVALSNETTLILTTLPRASQVNYSLVLTNVVDWSSTSNQVSSTPIPLKYVTDVLRIDTNTIWRYEQSGFDPGANWRSAGFDDSYWLAGPALFYERPNGVPPIPIGTRLRLTNALGTAQVITYYFRTEFEMPGHSTSPLSLRHVIDDGAAVYVNDQLLYSIRVSPPLTNESRPTVLFGTPVFEPPTNQPPYSITNLAIPGYNLIAAEVHQWTPTANSDVAFALSLEALIDEFLPRLSVTLPAIIGEANGTVTNGGVVALDSPLATNLTIQLFVARSNSILVPTQVTIFAGAVSAPFNLTVTNDSLLNSDRTVTVTARAPGFVTSSASTLLTDDEFAVLDLKMPPSFREGDAALTGVVSVSRAPDVEVVVWLTLSNAGLTVPLNVVIPAGATSTVFSVGATDDRIIEETQFGSVTASLGNWIPATSTVIVIDNEATNMTLLLPLTATEGDGVRANAGQVFLPGVVSSNLVVALSSSDATKLTVPGTVLIPAGQSNAFFDLTIVDNALTDGTKASIVTAAAHGFESATGTVTVADNDLHHFVFSDINSPQFQGTAFAVTIDALDVSGVRLLSFSNQVSLSAISGGEGVTSFGTKSIRFVAGRWASNTTFALPVPWVRLVATFGGVSTQSQPFDVDPTPLRILSLAANDIVYLANSNRLWATIGGRSPAYPNTLVEIDPVGGVVVSSFPIGPEPVRLVKTENERFLYVSYGTHPFVVANGTYVRQFDVTNRQFSFTIGDGSTPVYDLAPVRGNPNLVVLALRFGGGSAGEIRVYDNGVPRPTALPQIQDPWLSRLEISATTNLLYAIQDGAFSRLQVNGNGIAFQGYAGPIYVNEGFKANGPLVYSTLGKVVDPQAGTLVGSYPDSGGNAIEIDASLQRTFLVSGGGTAPYSHSIRVYDQYSGARAGALNVSGVTGVATRLVRFGAKGLAFSTGSKLALVESDMLVPSNTFADLVIKQSIAPDTNSGGSNFFCTVTVSNRGPQVAFRPLVTGSLPTGAILLSSNVTEGAVQIQDGVLNWRLSELPVGGTAIGILLFAPSAEPILTNTLAVVSRNIDTNATNSVSTASPQLPVVDVRLSQTYLPNPALIGSNITYFLTVSNAATNAAWQVIVRDQLPIGSSLVASNASQGWLFETNGDIEWRISGLAPGASATAALTVSFSLAGWYRNAASASLWSGDTLPSNNVSVLWHYVSFTNTPAHVVAMNTPVTDMIYDPQRHRLIASIGTNGGYYSNSVLFIDPHSGQADASISLETPPAKLARSDDGQFLYVSLPEAAVVRRFALSTLSSNLQFSLGGESIYGRWYPWFAEDIRVLPGQPNSVAVSRVRQAGPFADQWNEGVAIVDDGALRPNTTSGCQCWYSLEFGASASNLYASRYNVTIDRFAVDGGGVSLVEVGNIGGVNPELKFASGLMYATSGRAFDPQTLQLVGTFTGAQNAVTFELDAQNARAYFLTRTNSNWILLGFDTGTFASVGALLLTNISGTPSNLVQWADEGFAFHTSSRQLYLVRSSNFKNADVRLSVAVSNSVVFAQQPFQLQWDVWSAGPDATSVVISNRLPPFLGFLGATASTGTVFLTNGSAFWSVGTIASNVAASVVLRLMFTNASDAVVTNLTSAVATVPDPINSNNMVLLRLTTLIDNNGNGLGDTWELQNFGPFAVSPTGDPDNDGISNQYEFANGTDPNDSSNVLRIAALTVGSNTTSLTFFAARDHNYVIEKSASLEGIWLEAFSVAGESKRITWTAGRDGATAFYRVAKRF